MLALITIVLLSSTLWSSTLAATTKPPSSPPQACGLRWNTRGTGNPKTVSCQNFGKYPYICNLASCGIGGVQPGHRAASNNIVFDKCRQYEGELGKSQLKSGSQSSITADTYYTYWKANYADVIGRSALSIKNGDKTRLKWKCDLERPDELPICGECTYDAHGKS